MGDQSEAPLNRKPWWKRGWIVPTATVAGAVMVPFVVTMVTLATHEEIAEESNVVQLLGIVIGNQEKRAEDIGAIKANLGTVTKDVGTLTRNLDTVTRNLDTVTKDVGEIKGGLDRIESAQDKLIAATTKLEDRVAGLERKVEAGLIVNVPVPDTGKSDKDAAPHLPG